MNVEEKNRSSITDTAPIFWLYMIFESHDGEKMTTLTIY